MKKKAANPLNFFFRNTASRITALAVVSTSAALAQTSSKPVSARDLLPVTVVTASDSLPPASDPQDAQSAPASTPNLKNLFFDPYTDPNMVSSVGRIPPMNPDYFPPNPFSALVDKFKADAEAWKLGMNGNMPTRELLPLYPIEKDGKVSKQGSSHTYHVGLILMTESIHVFGTQKYIGGNGELKPFNDGNGGGILYWGGTNVDYFIGGYKSSVNQFAWGGGVEVKKRFKLGNTVVMNVGGLFAALPNGYNKQRIADPIEPGAGAIVLELLSNKFPLKNDVDRFFAKIPGMDEPTRKCYAGFRAMVVPPGNNGSLVFNAELKVGCSVTHLKPH